MGRIRMRVGAVVAAIAAVAGLGVVAAVPAQAADPCQSGPALVFPGVRDQLIQARTGSTGITPDATVGYKVDNASNVAVAVAVRGYDNAGKETWKGFPLSGNGSFSTVQHWGEVISVQAIKVTNLDPLRTASVSFTC